MPSNAIKPYGTEITTRPIGIGTWQNVLATPGTTGAGANTATAIAARVGSVWVPGDCLVTGIRFLQGLTAATTKAIGVLYDEGGAVLAYSAIAGVTMATASTFKELPFTTRYSLSGPGLFFLGVIFDGTGSTYGTVPANCHMGTIGGTSVQLFTTPTALVTVPTAFNDALIPIAHLY